ncbi:MAG: VWA domain-containing protein [Burkholderiales bacterium]|nr:VWA domain-containing protein [Burkholderiales bacterium]OJX06386.1 MAG: ABC transporter ATP-binding protein [Burkholderiales bacterium 70-64]
MNLGFLWPDMLWLLLALPLLVGAYVWALRRRKKAALRYAGLSIVKEAMGRGQGLRRHLPPLLFLVALAAMILAIARPSATLTLPSQHEIVILAMDVSGSMRATDVAPSRMAAAQAAARAFIAEQPRKTRIGVVTFGGSAALVQPPTHSRDDLLAAIERFELQRGTAVGSGILTALKTIFPDEDFDAQAQARESPRARRGTPLDPPRNGKQSTPGPDKPVAPGSYSSAVVILLSDGQTTTGPDPIESARIAAEHGVRIYTVGIGTQNGEILVGDGWSMRVRLDEDALKEIARTTHGEYFYAGTADELKTIYSSMTTKIVLERRETEITALFSAAGALAAVLAALLSMLWFNRIF